MKATFEGGQGPEGAVVPWMDGCDILSFHRELCSMQLVSKIK
jgi:hypothetical protein